MYIIDFNLDGPVSPENKLGGDPVAVFPRPCRSMFLVHFYCLSSIGFEPFPGKIVAVSPSLAIADILPPGSSMGLKWLF